MFERRMSPSISIVVMGLLSLPACAGTDNAGTGRELPKTDPQGRPISPGTPIYRNQWKTKLATIYIRKSLRPINAAKLGKWEIDAVRFCETNANAPDYCDSETETRWSSVTEKDKDGWFPLDVAIPDTCEWVYDPSSPMPEPPDIKKPDCTEEAARQGDKGKTPSPSATAPPAPLPPQFIYSPSNSVRRISLRLKRIQDTSQKAPAKKSWEPRPPASTNNSNPQKDNVLRAGTLILCSHGLQRRQPWLPRTIILSDELADDGIMDLGGLIYKGITGLPHPTSIPSNQPSFTPEIVDGNENRLCTETNKDAHVWFVLHAVWPDPHEKTVKPSADAGAPDAAADAAGTTPRGK